MSGTGSESGWWQASDGRWYPPELHPDHGSRQARVDPEAEAPPGVPTSGEATSPPGGPRPDQGPADPTGPEDGSAVRRAPVSAEELSRRRFSVGAAVLIVVLFVVFVVLVVTQNRPSTPTSTAPTPPMTTATLGQLVTLSDARHTGISSARVLTITGDVTTAGGNRPAQGRQLVAVDVEICAGPQGAVGPDVSRFTVVLPTGLASPVVGLTTMSPSLWQYDSLTAHQCARGFLSYDVASSVQPTTVRYAEDSGRVVLWRS